MRINKITVIIVALVAVCATSFFVVRQLTKGEQIDNPIIYVSTTEAPITAAPIVTESYAPSTEPTTEPTTTEAPTSESTTTLPVSESSSVFTTFPMDNTTAPSTSVTQVTTTAAPATTTTQPTTTQKNEATTAFSAEKDPYIKEAAKTSSGFLGYLYNATDNYYYTANDAWHRNFGFNAAFDSAAQFGYMYFDTARVYFDYIGKNWMVEFWKGQYGGVFIGAEIGVYYKKPERTIKHFDCVTDEDSIFMEMTLYRDGYDKPLFSTDYHAYWWCTGFVPGKLKKYSDRSELTVKARLTMKDKAMLKAFKNGLENCVEFEFHEGDNYICDKLDVYITWK